jgi:hypothetical protein
MFIFKQSLSIFGYGLVINYTKAGKAFYTNSDLIFNFIDSQEISNRKIRWFMNASKFI